MFTVQKSTYTLGANGSYGVELILRPETERIRKEEEPNKEQEQEEEEEEQQQKTNRKTHARLLEALLKLCLRWKHVHISLSLLRFDRVTVRAGGRAGGPAGGTQSLVGLAADLSVC